jgi:hypothetical protein
MRDPKNPVIKYLDPDNALFVMKLADHFEVYSPSLKRSVFCGDLGNGYMWEEVTVSLQQLVNKLRESDPCFGFMCDMYWPTVFEADPNEYDLSERINLLASVNDWIAIQ